MKFIIKDFFSKINREKALQKSVDRRKRRHRPKCVCNGLARPRQSFLDKGQGGTVQFDGHIKRKMHQVDDEGRRGKTGGLKLGAGFIM